MTVSKMRTFHRVHAQRCIFISRLTYKTATRQRKRHSPAPTENVRDSITSYAYRYAARSIKTRTNGYIRRKRCVPSSFHCAPNTIQFNVHESHVYRIRLLTKWPGKNKRFLRPSIVVFYSNEFSIPNESRSKLEIRGLGNHAL